MAGVQDSALAAAVSNAGALGSLPAALLTPDRLRDELVSVTNLTSNPYNVNFFCHVTPDPDLSREARWLERLAPYYREFGVDPPSFDSGDARQCDTFSVRSSSEL